MALAHSPAHAPRLDTVEERWKELRMARRAAIRDVMPILVAMLPLALAVGMTVAESEIAAWVGWLAAPLVFAGASHLAVVSMLDTGVTPVIAVGAALVVNARFAVYGAAISPLFERQPRWFRLVGPHLLVDQSFALIVGRPERHDPEWMRQYYMTSSLALATMWVTGVALGIALQPVLPQDWPISAAAPVMVGALLGVSIRSPRAGAVAAAAFVVAAVLTPLIGATGIIVAAAAGVLVGRCPAPPIRLDALVRGRN